MAPTSIEMFQQHLASSPALLLNVIPEPFLILDNDKRILIANDAAQQALGKTLTMVGKLVTEFIPLGDAENTANNGKQLPDWILADKIFVTHLQPFSLSSHETEILGYTLFLEDVTGLRKLTRNQTEFVRIVAHDLRTPLTSIQGFTSMLEMVGDLTEKQHYFISKILSGINHLTHLVDSIQDAGRYDPESGFKETRSPTDLREIVRRILEHHIVPADKSLQIKSTIDEDIPLLNLDPIMIERAIGNLVDNAIKYTPTGGYIHVGLVREADRILLSVEDTGLGINPEHMGRLFERHVRIVRPEFKKIKGTGLGLFIVRSVARRHDGEAWIESVEGQGSTFFISLPLNGANSFTQ
jgi:two-component system phosphate regulon sensor histidine kinase PhoR